MGIGAVKLDGNFLAVEKMGAREERPGRPGGMYKLEVRGLNRPLAMRARGRFL